MGAGRSPVVVPLPGVQIEQLTSEERAFPLGTIGAQGFATMAFTVPATLPQGFTFYAQGRVMRGALELLTNSAPCVLRQALPAERPTRRPRLNHGANLAQPRSARGRWRRPELVAASWPRR